MLRYDRSRFLAFGVLQALNAIGLLLYGLGLATHGTGGAGRSLPVLIVLAVVCLLMALVAAVRRGRDVGWPAWMTVVAFWLSLVVAPVLLGLIAYFAFAKPRPKADTFGSPAPPATMTTWVWALMNLLWPWLVLGVLARTL